GDPPDPQGGSLLRRALDLRALARGIRSDRSRLGQPPAAHADRSSLHLRAVRSGQRRGRQRRRRGACGPLVPDLLLPPALHDAPGDLMSIQLAHITKRYAGQTVVDRVSLEVQKGELFVLLGASGSGKSTVLRLISGLLAPDEGTIRLGGRDVTAFPPQKRDVGFVFQNYSIFRHMTVAENIEFGLRIRKVSRVERKRRREDLLDLVG